MTMYRMRQREFDPRRSSTATLELRAVAARSGRSRIARRCSPRTRTRSRRSRRRSRTTCWPSSSSSSATRARLQAAYDRTNRNPLGACAITGTGFPIDRQLTAELLGFDGADRQHLRQHRDGRLPARERVGGRGAAGRARPRSCRICCCGAPREFGYLRLGDGFVQCSSIMPQKRNPVALEHARAIGSKALGQAQAIVHQRPQHAVRRHRRHRGRPAAAGVRRCSATRRAR